MNNLQKTEFEMLKIFIEICEKLNLEYYLVCGSCLGAVKYSGFIPWDDDLDVALPRDDYEIFIKEASKFLPDNIFLQNYHTDEKYPLFMSKLRNCQTTLIEKSFDQISMNHGVYIDVFPLDGYPEDISEINFVEKEKGLFNRHRIARCNYNRYSIKNIRNVKNIIVRWLYLIFGYCSDTQKITSRFDNIAKQYDCYKSKLLCNHGNWQGKLEYAPKEQYGNGTWATFEGLKVRIPENYDAYLTQKYGDWRSDPPPEKQNSGHDFMIVDTTRPYTEYIVKLKNGIIRLKTSEELLSSGITPPEGYKY